MGEDIWRAGGSRGCSPPALGCCCGNILVRCGWGLHGVALGECGGRAGGWWWGKGKPCLHHACALPVCPAFPPLPACAKEPFVLLGFFSPLLIPNQEIKGRQRLRLFPLCRELESSGRGDHPFPDRPRGGGRAAQVEGPRWRGGHPGSGSGRYWGPGWGDGTWVLRGGPRWGGPGAQGSGQEGGRLSPAEEEEEG